MVEAIPERPCGAAEREMLQPQRTLECVPSTSVAPAAAAFFQFWDDRCPPAWFARAPVVRVIDEVQRQFKRAQ